MSLPAEKIKSTVYVSSLQCLGILWQCLALDSSIHIHAGLGRYVICNLCSGDKVLATMRLGFRTYRDLRGAMAAAESSRSFEPPAGTCKIIL